MLVPSLAEKRAVEAFATPVRPDPSPEPVVPGLEAHHFHMRLGENQIAAWDWGDGGPTVLLVHGWNGTASQMSGLVAPLVKAGFFVVAIDLPAHGRSTGDRANIVDLRNAVLDAGRRLHPVHAVIAHSLGATATALALARGLAVERAVLLAPPADLPFFARAFGARLGLPPRLRDGMVERLRKELGDLDALDLRALAPSMKVPALVMHDPGDVEVPFEQGLSIARAWPGATLRRLNDLGHVRPLRDPATIAAAVSFVTGTRQAELRAAS